MNTPIASSSTRRGFTLVELLTVIAIIGILAAILIPVVGTAKSSARRSEAAASLRNIGNSFRLYANENRDSLPGPSWSHGNYAGYVYDNNSGSQIGRNLCAYLQRYLETPPSTNGAWMESPAFKPANFMATDPTGNRAYHFAYQVNHNKDGSIDVDTAVNPFGTPRWQLKRIENPSKTWLVKDLDQLNRPSNSAPGGGYMAPKPFNGSARNVLYFDGHVATEPVL